MAHVSPRTRLDPHEVVNQPTPDLGGLGQCDLPRRAACHGPTDVSDTFCRTRLGEEVSPAYGILPTDAPVAAILSRIVS